MIIIINDLDIMVTLNGIYYEYIKIVHKIFVKYIVPILQVYPYHFIIYLKFIKNIYYYYNYYYYYYYNTSFKK